VYLLRQRNKGFTVMGPIEEVTVNVWTLNERNMLKGLILNVKDHSQSYIKITDKRSGRSCFVSGVYKCGNTEKA
jgi:hypothetical protein